MVNHKDNTKEKPFRDVHFSERFFERRGGNSSFFVVKTKVDLR